MTTIELPHNWRPRDYQVPLWHALEMGTTRAAAVWHRRAGKDLFAIHWLARQAMERVGLYWHILPTYRQARKVVWEGRTREGIKFLDAFGPRAPNEGPLIERARDDEMTLWLRNGSMYQCIGADEPDRLIGANPLGVVFSEWSVMNPQAWELIRPILVENGGFAIFIYTPRGRNHGWKLLQRARENEEWFAQVLTVEDTHAVPMEAIEAERRAGMPEELIEQEFYCSFDAPLVGSYFGEIVTELFAKGRITKVPHDPDLPVDTAWDIGVSDTCVIWFAQQAGADCRLIDLYASSGYGADHYVRELQQKPHYVYRRHYVPHDAKNREFASGKTTLHTMRRLGIIPTVVPRVSIPDRINAGRMLLPRCTIDETACEIGVEALKQYRKQRLENVLDPDGRPVFKDVPVHDWTSHYADSFTHLALGQRTPMPKPGEGDPAPRSRVAIV